MSVVKVLESAVRTFAGTLSKIWADGALMLAPVARANQKVARTFGEAVVVAAAVPACFAMLAITPCMGVKSGSIPRS